MTEERFLANIDKNRTWFWSAVELLGLSFYFVWANQYFEYPPPKRDILLMLDNSESLIIVAGIAVAVIVWSIWNFDNLHANQIMPGLLVSALLVYTTAFILRDIDLGNISLATIYSTGLVLRATHEALRVPELRMVKKRIKAIDDKR
ncbi:hypothetical protein [Lacticaseibacillus saniviri]|uniref:Uncharacterized protein n=1 Tax=Lacticaseibacillus saniviri JCM 17471 = DSM 24301 TaxID=1293598 RepID=A0A0R2MT38_9LACO|nr:hypothetical protein [Lacticaseibacillus saniviri]KRO16617.1 hypothetical protein IV56_GL001060 [Lacticaseibacillus saniviri JCM 17471 = DSM 24301]